jgi:murein biosynthesis integral membrane protein MurJ
MLGMILGLITDVLYAARFGTSETADVLIVSITLPLLFDTITREGTRLSLVPVFVHKRNNSTPAHYWKYLSGLLNLAMVFGIVLWGITVVFSSYIIGFIGPGLDEISVETGSIFLQNAGLSVFLIPSIAVLSISLNSSKIYNVVALRNSITPTVVILTMLITWENQKILYSLAWAYSLSFLIYFGILVLSNAHIGFRYSLNLPNKESLSELRSAISWPTLGFMIRQSSRVVEKMIASSLMVGGVSSYHYAFRIFSSIQTIIGSSIATTSLPEIAGVKDIQIRKTLRIKLKRILWITVPIAVFFLVFNHMVIRIIYFRGGFDQLSIETTSDLLFWLAFGVIFVCMIPILNAVLYALSEFRYAFLNMLIMSIINVTLGYLLSIYLGIIGIGMAISITSTVSVLSLLLFLNKKGIKVFKNND